MVEIVQHEKFGQIMYEESFWTGKKTLKIGGTQLTKQNKTTYIWDCNGEKKTVFLKGNYVTGVKLTVDGSDIQLTASAKWYEIVCSVMIFVLILVWGNSVDLCRIVPVMGGAIGGGVSGAMAFLNLTMMKTQKKVGLKLAIWLAMMVLTFGICFVLAKVYLNLMF